MGLCFCQALEQLKDTLAAHEPVPGQETEGEGGTKVADEHKDEEPLASNSSCSERSAHLYMHAYVRYISLVYPLVCIIFAQELGACVKLDSSVKFLFLCSTAIFTCICTVLLFVCF